ncbi:MAG: PEGA domain-containing protein [Myxococcales bacterium]
MRAEPVLDAFDADQGGEQVPNAFEPDPHSATTKSFPLPEDGAPVDAEQPRADETLPEPLRTDLDGALLDGPAAGAATDLDMDWDDDEEVETRLRDEEPSASAPPPSPGGTPSPFPSSAPAPLPSLGGAEAAPSPFSQAPPAAPEAQPEAASAQQHAYEPYEGQGDWEDDDAVTRVMPSVLAGVPGPAPIPSVAPVTTSIAPDETLAGEDFGRGKRRGALWIGLAAAAAVLLGLAFGGPALLGGDDPGTVTLVTVPADAEVLVDGRPLSGQSSPFTVQGLSPEMSHTVEIRKEGFASVSSSFELASGEVKALDSVELEPLALETGFALDSKPTGAAIFVDGEKLEQTTPARITDLEPGLHTVRLEHGDGYQPWQTQVALASGQVIGLPEATLAEAAGAVGHDDDTAVANADEGEEPRRELTDAQKRRRERRAERRAERRERRAERRAARRKSASASSKQVAATSGGSKGTLRINSRPWSQVFVDGKLVGNTPQLNIPLSSGRHKVKLVNPDMGMTKRFSVRIAGGKPTTKIVNLLE